MAPRICSRSLFPVQSSTQICNIYTRSREAEECAQRYEQKEGTLAGGHRPSKESRKASSKKTVTGLCVLQQGGRVGRARETEWLRLCDP